LPQVTFMPAGRSVSVRVGTSLLEAGRKAGAGIRTRCGGVAGCLMCKVSVRNPAAVTPMNAAERRKLGESASDGSLRLACQANVVTDVIVDVPEDPLKAAVRKHLERLRKEEEDGFT